MTTAYARTLPAEYSQPARLRVADLLSKAVFGFLLILICLTAIPYGTIEPWWKALFVCGVFAVCIVAILENLLSGTNRVEGIAVLLPLLALTALAFLQTISLPSGPTHPVSANMGLWNAISADPYETRFVVLQLLALTTFLALLYRYAADEKRVQILIYTVIAVAVASAIYGIVRQTMQHDPGF